jgi:hypothetical protein
MGEAENSPASAIGTGKSRPVGSVAKRNSVGPSRGRWAAAQIGKSATDPAMPPGPAPAPVVHVGGFFVVQKIWSFGKRSPDLGDGQLPAGVIPLKGRLTGE